MPIETISLGSGERKLTIPRIITGLWSLAYADADIPSCVRGVEAHVASGLGVFDVADHYGPAEQVIGEYHTTNPRIKAFTKWCPAPGLVGTEACAAAVAKAADRMRVGKVDLLQYHVWKYEDPSYLTNLYELSLLQKSGKVGLVGVTNMDLLHLRMLHSSGYEIASNQVSMSVIDRRAEIGGLAAWCHENNIGLLAYGVLLGGFISEKWLGRAEPQESELSTGLMKYLRFINAAGGWTQFQSVLGALDSIARKHEISIANVAMRYVLDIPGVAAVIIGSSLTTDRQDKYIQTNLSTFEIVLDDADRAAIAAAQEGLTSIPGDCGDEYRYPPYLTASGDISHHFSQDQAEKDRLRSEEIERVIKEGGRVEVSSGSPYEPICGYCRAVRFGDTFEIAGTITRAHPSGVGVIGGSSSAADQTTNIMDIITNAVHAVGGSMSDITRTRIFNSDISQWQSVARVHGSTMAHYDIRPVCTMVGGNSLIGGGILVEIEVMGVVGSGKGRRLRV